MAFAKFIRFGYSKSIDLQDLADKCKSIEDKFSYGGLNRSKYYSKVLLSLGFGLDEFKIGNDVIFVRSNKFELMEQFLHTMREDTTKEHHEQK